jgi:hypothetical protein
MWFLGEVSTRTGLNAIDVIVTRHGEIHLSRSDVLGGLKMLNVSERWAAANRMGITASAVDVAPLYAPERALLRRAPSARAQVGFRT